MSSTKSTNQQLINKIKKLEAELANAKGLLETNLKGIYTAMSEGMCLHELVFDNDNSPVDYRILDVNPKYEELVGLKSKDVVDKLATEIYPGGIAPY